MFRNNYDSDITTWSPQGRLFQIEYAMEAVKQGSAAVGLKSNEFAILVTLKKAISELSSSQRKMFKVDDHCGIAIAGLTADARLLSKYMRTECLNHRFVYESPIQLSRLVTMVADKSAKGTMNYGRRPYGVGILVAGYDSTGAHLFQTDPSGNYFDYKAMAIGARSQSAKTYLEKNYEQFAESSKEDLIRHALLALRETIAGGRLESKSTSLAIVGVNTPFQIIEDEAIMPYIDAVEKDLDAKPLPAGAALGGPPTAVDSAASTGGHEDMQM